MTIRRRLGLSFLFLLILLAVNLAIYFWSAALRTRTMKALERALTRQVVLASLRQELDNLHKQVTLLSQVTVEEAGGGTNPEARRLFTQKVERVAGHIGELKELTEPSLRAEFDGLATTYDKLADAWKGFYQYFGTNQALALGHVIQADPLSQRLLTQVVPAMQEKEKQRVREAEAESNRVAWRTNVLTLVIFLLSTVVAVAVAFSVSRYLTEGLGELKLGAAFIGGGEFDHRILRQGNDELADLANAFNDMAENLKRAHTQLTQAKENLEGRNQELEKQQKLADSLLLNILPYQVAIELQAKGAADPKYFEDATILFTDFVGFTLSTEKLAAEDLVMLLHDYFTAFDEIIMRYHLEKLKTIGDSYMCVGGLPVGRRSRRTPSHPVDVLLAAFEMVRAVAERDRPDSSLHWAVRVGIHTGPLISGVVGIQKFAFDIWGETVNYASRMESGGAPNRINLSAATYARVKDFFECEYRGKVLTKEKKEFEMYFAKGILPSLVDDPSQSPPPAFLRRYRIYFQKDPPAFPAFLLESAPTTNRIVV